MKRKISIIILLLISTFSFAQKETFDLATFTPPNAWKKQTTASAVQFSKEDAAKGTYCLITLYKAVPGTANSKENFDLAWESLVTEMVTISTNPEILPVTTENSWEVQSGHAPFESDSSKGVVLLVTASSAEKMVNLIILTNTDLYEKETTTFLESVSLKKQVTKTAQAQTPSSKNDNALIIGSWGKSNSVSQINNRYGPYSYNKQQYTFNANGTYRFLGKNYSDDYAEILLIKESGSYTISGDLITIVPKSSVIESWSKKNGADIYNQLKSSQKRALEKVSYRVSRYGKNLILSTNKETTRDGRFSNGNYYSYGPPETFTAIKIPG